MDVVGCGIDVFGILYIINYDVLYFSEDYVYCVGWIGRMGCEGVVYIFVILEEGNYFIEIEKMINKFFKCDCIEGIVDLD